MKKRRLIKISCYECQSGNSQKNTENIQVGRIEYKNKINNNDELLTTTHKNQLRINGESWGEEKLRKKGGSKAIERKGEGSKEASIMVRTN